MAKNKTGSSHDYIIHPGETLCELLDDRGMSQNQLALRTGFSSKHISEIVNGKASITAKFATALQPVFGVSSQFWINLQSGYDLEIESASNIANKDEFSIN